MDLEITSYNNCFQIKGIFKQIEPKNLQCIISNSIFDKLDDIHIRY